MDSSHRQLAVMAGMAPWLAVFMAGGKQYRFAIVTPYGLLVFFQHSEQMLHGSGHALHRLVMDWKVRTGQLKIRHHDHCQDHLSSVQNTSIAEFSNVKMWSHADSCEHWLEVLSS